MTCLYTVYYTFIFKLKNTQEGKQYYVVYLFSYVYLNTRCLYNERIVVKLLVYIQFIKDTNTILIAYLLINIHSTKSNIY